MNCGHTSYPQSSTKCAICAITSDTIKPISRIYLEGWGILCKCNIGHLFVYSNPICPICAMIKKFASKCKLEWIGGVYVCELSMINFYCRSERKNRWYKSGGEEPILITCNMRITVNAIHSTDKTVCDCDSNHIWNGASCAPLMALTAIEAYFSASFNDFYSFKTHVTGFNQLLNIVIIHVDQTEKINDIQTQCSNHNITLIIVKGRFKHAIIGEIINALSAAGKLHSGHDSKTAKIYMKNRKNDMQSYTNTPKYWPDALKNHVE